jgi:uncharacterized phage protein (TIGR01671 family)
MTQREIKFRAWDKVDHEWYKKNPKLSRMTYFANPFISDDGYIQFEAVDQDPIGDCPQDRFVLMQYTGLKDKNGEHEIYEGDVVRVMDTQNGDVRFHDGCFYVCWVGGGKTPLHDWDVSILQDHWMKDVEVIGNVFENKDLLKEKK